MISFVFDNNVLQDLVELDDYSRVKNLLSESIMRKFNKCFYTELNFMETLKGVTAKNFVRLRDMVREAYLLSGRGYLLRHPSDHVRISIRRVDAGFEETLSDIQRKRIKRFVDCESYTDFVKNFGEESDFRKQEAMEAFDKLTEDTKELLDDFDTVKETSGYKKDDTLLGDGKFSQFYEAFLPSLLTLFGIRDCFGEVLNMESVTRAVPSLRSISELQWVYFRKIHFDGKKVDEGDFYDRQFALYLSFADYLVTNDGSLQTLFNESFSRYLYGRAISLKKFIYHLENGHRSGLLSYRDHELPDGCFVRIGAK